jgi:hypothetical protein
MRKEGRPRLAGFSEVCRNDRQAYAKGPVKTILGHQVLPFSSGPFAPLMLGITGIDDENRETPKKGSDRPIFSAYALFVRQSEGSTHF